MSERLHGKKLFDEYKKNVSTSKNVDEDGIKYCTWCGNYIIEKRRYRYCSEECSHEFKLEFARRYNWTYLRDTVMKKYGGICQHCGKRDYNAEVHHKLPRCRGGTDREDNLTVLCHECHMAQHHRTTKRNEVKSHSLLNFL